MFQPSPYSGAAPYTEDRAAAMQGFGSSVGDVLGLFVGPNKVVGGPAPDEAAVDAELAALDTQDTGSSLTWLVVGLGVVALGTVGLVFYKNSPE